MVRALTSHQCGPGLIPGPGIICGLSLLMVLYSALRGFYSSTPVFPSPRKPTFPNSNLILECMGISNEFLWTPAALWVNKLHLHLNCHLFELFIFSSWVNTLLQWSSTAQFLVFATTFFHLVAGKKWLRMFWTLSPVYLWVVNTSQSVCSLKMPFYDLQGTKLNLAVFRKQVD